MTHALRFEGLTLTVENVARSVAFYGGVLGLNVAYNSEPAFALIKIDGDNGGSIGLLSVEEARKEVLLFTSLVGSLIEEKLRDPQYQITEAEIQWATRRWLRGILG